MNWVYGVTTVPSRKDDLLPRTLASLARGGFDKPRLFVDGVDSPASYAHLGLELTTRRPAIRAFGNWALALLELYLREPVADRYAIFQDDLVTYRNLKQYLEQCPYPIKGYWNLYTFPHNCALSGGKQGWFLSDQMGRGAVGLVFSREAVTVLLKHQHFVDRVQDPRRGWKSIDGGISTSFKDVGWVEYVHNPSLLQHTGVVSSMHNHHHPLADSFRGEDYNVMELL